MYKARDSRFLKWYSRGVVLCLASCALLGMQLVSASSAHAAANATSLACGYDAASSTLTPIASITRSGAPQGGDNRVRVVLELYDGSTLVKTLGTGPLGSGANALGEVDDGQTIGLTPNNGVVFGDGSEFGGPALKQNHDYTVRVRTVDFGSEFQTYFASFTCRTVTTPTECRTSPNRQLKRAEFSYDARVVLRRAPDDHLFKFEPTVIYCHGAGLEPQITSAFTYGFIDSGVSEGLLQALGFTYRYGNEQVTHVGSTALLSGDFEVSFDWLSLGKRIGANKVVEKAISKKLEKKLMKLMLKGGLKKDARRAYIEASVKVRNDVLAKYSDWSRKAVGKLPGPLEGLGEKLTGALGKKLKEQLNGYLRDVQLVASPKRLSEKSAKKIVGELTGLAKGRFREATSSEFSVWSPQSSIEVLDDGNLLVDDAPLFRNPFLKIERSRSIADIAVVQSR